MAAASPRVRFAALGLDHVHALGQVAHVDLDREAAPDTVRDAINFHLKPAPVSILAADLVDADFHARFSARERAYVYRITNRRSPYTSRIFWICLSRKPPLAVS